MQREEQTVQTKPDRAPLKNTPLPRNYGSTSTTTKMEGGVSGDSPALELTPSYVAAPDIGGRNRKITVTNVHIPRTRRKWYEYLKSFARLQFRRSSPHSNQIHTTKYTILTFLPKNLFEQFHRLANLYFLLIIILNFIPDVEVFGKEVSWVPLSVILLVTAVKDAIEDIRRYRSDKELNGLPCFVYDFDQSNFILKCWKDVHVGDFIRLGCDETIPADLLLLWSSDEDDLCYIQTSNLDGETNLKQRQVPVGIVEGVKEDDKQSGSDDSRQEQDYSFTFNPLRFSGELFCEPPNNQIYQFKGYVKNENDSVVPLSRNHLLLRGCVLRNTNSVVGVVAYAGHETKAMLNISGTRAKRSKLERDINTEIISQFILLFLLCLIGAILSGLWTGRHINRNIVFFPFSSDDADPALEGFIRFWSFVIILQVIVPISLYITMEIVKIAQVIFISWDLDMYYEPRDRPFQCRALNINEDLGQIKYVFSDKTGTLTENEMVFKCCSIGGSNYLHSVSEKTLSDSKSAVVEETDYPSTPSVPVSVDPQLVKDIDSPDFKNSLIHDFMINMAICNTVVVSRQASSQKNGTLEPNLIYEAESPDEYALVEGARSYGYILLSRSPSLIRLKTPHHGILEFEPLRVLEFSSERKRMSVMVRDRNSGVITLYCKGADSVICSRLSFSGLNPSIKTDTQEHLDHYARLGLRTLCLSKRVLSEETYQDWLSDYKNAELDLINRDDLQAECADKIERQLHLLGASGIEDRLQDGVPDTIQSLRRAGMKVWVLTGDKKETAINVGYASKLLTQDTEVIHLKAKSEEECLEHLQDLINGMFPSLRHSLEVSQASIFSNTVGRVQVPFRRLHATLSWSKQSDTLDNSLIKQMSRKALVVDGATLEFAFRPSCKELFRAVAKECYSVICCRATPLKKARVVELIKESETALTLAIGDGANDVSMIQMANVGVGIAGREGMQAVLASDFNMARFKYLKKLLLVHGHWCYSRLANMMLYFFYKNIMYAVLLFWYQLFNGFSGSNPIDGINLQIFNLVYTSLPIMVAAVADQDLKPKQLLTNEEHYQRGQQSRVYTRLKFWLVVVEAFYQSLVVFLVAYGAFYNSTIGITSFGFVINISVVLVASLHMALEFLHWTWLHHFFLWGSCLVLFVFNYAYCAIDSQQRIMDTYYVLQVLSGDSRFWFVLLITPIIALFPRVVGKILNQDIFPDSVLKARADESRGKKIVIDEDSLESAAQ